MKPIALAKGIVVAFLCLLIGGNFAATRAVAGIGGSPDTPDVKEWVGVYPFHEFVPPGLFAEYHIVVLNRGGTSQIIVNGSHGTCQRLNGTARPVGTRQLNVYFESVAFGCDLQTRFSKGDLLVSLEKASKGYRLHWGKLEPLERGVKDRRPVAAIYREDEGIADDGRKIEGPYSGEGFFDRLSPAGVCGYDVEYQVFYNVSSRAAASINEALRSAGVPSAQAMKKCDEMHGREPRPERAVRYCETVREVSWVNRSRIGSVLLQESESTPCQALLNMRQLGMTFDFDTGRFFNYSDLFRPESRGPVDKLIFNFLARKVKQMGIDYPWEQFLKDKKETYQFCLWSNVANRLVTLRILDFPSDWFAARIDLGGGLEPELPLEQIKNYANPDGPLALIVSRK